MSTFVWIDHSEKQRRQLLDAIDQFREKDTRDELGTAGIRDAFADMLFPGTGALQTRARYFLFVPWMYLQMEGRKVPSSEIARKARDVEVRLINALADSADNKGTIGIEARERLQRLPSNVYWNGLKTLRICEFEGSQTDYQRSLDKFYQARDGRRVAEDNETAGRRVGNFDADVPPVPAAFPNEGSFDLTRAEAGYLRESVRENHPGTMFEFVLARPLPEKGPEFVWDLDMLRHADANLKRKVEHARCFSEVRQGAAILYNLFLARMNPVRGSVIETCDELWADWLEVMEKRSADHARWDRQDFWRLLEEQERTPKQPTKGFVDAWCEMALGSGLESLRESKDAQELISSREYAIKGALARFKELEVRRRWRGESGLGQIDYRWSNALVFARDIQKGMRSHA